MSKESFIFYRDWYEGMRELDASVKAELYEAIIKYALDGEMPELSPSAKMIFSFLMPKIERDMRRYEERCERNRRNGEKGGRPKTPKTPKTHKNPKNPVGYLETHKNPKNPVGGDNDNDKDKDKDSQEPKGSMSEDSTLLTEGMSDSGAVPTRPKTIREVVIAYFNDKMKGKEIKSIRSIADGTQRAEWLKKRIELYGLSAVYEVIDKAAASSFLNGGNKRGWMATFDWLIRPNNFPKVLDGNYDDEKITDTTIEQTDWQS